MAVNNTLTTAIRREVYFVDMGLFDYKSITSGLPANAEIIYIQPETDGLGQIANYLATQTSIDAVHIFSHGSQGALYLGNTILNGDTLSTYQQQLNTIGSSLSDTGDILLYGCNVAQGEQGQSFINQLSKMTGADIAASDDFTGASNLGGDWHLEANIGEIESQQIVINGYIEKMDVISGSSGNDYLLGTTNNDTIIGGKGDDTLNGRYGDDSYLLTIGDGNDTYFDQSGENSIQFTNAISSDVHTSWDGNDLIIQYSMSDSLRINGAGYGMSNAPKLLKFADGAIWSTLELYSNRLGTSGHDWSLYGSSSNDTINGLAGKDVLIGGGGDDVLNGGTDNDKLFGDAPAFEGAGIGGNDTYVFAKGDGQDIVWDSLGQNVVQFTDVASTELASASIGSWGFNDGSLTLNYG